MKGLKHLEILTTGSVEEQLRDLPDNVKTEKVHPCGFVLDIDIELASRWQAVRNRLSFAGDASTNLVEPVPLSCPTDGYIGQVEGYPAPFGVWLMPDCDSNEKKLEHLIETLIEPDDPRWPHAKVSTAEARRLVNAANEALSRERVEGFRRQG